MTARRRAQVAPPTFGQATSLSAEFRRREHFRRQDHFRLHSLAGSNIGGRIRASADFRLQPAPTEFRRRISASEFKLQGGYETFPGSLQKMV